MKDDTKHGDKDSSFPPVVFRESKRLYYRPIEEGDIPRLYVWINNPDVHRYLTAYLPTTFQKECEWVMSLNKSDNGVILAVIEKDTHRHIGLTELDWGNKNAIQNHTAMLGIIIGDKSRWGKGYGTEVIGSILDYAFLTLNLRKINSGVFGPNEASYKCHIKNGFREIGRNPREQFIDGEYVDDIRLTIFKEDWLKNKK